MSLQSVRGTHDLLSKEAADHRRIEEVARQTAEMFGFDEISTPIFEFTSVFAKTLGDSSDIVGKEMYTFVDRGGESLTLRPEGTAGVARAYIQHGLSQLAPVKFFYSGPMFRYERPQKGRLRQFHQVGVEHLGSDSVFADVEIIELALAFLKNLGISANLTLELNSLGDGDSRAQYQKELVTHLNQHRDSLSADSQRRLTTNPLRILDSKDPLDQAAVASAPTLGQYLNATSGARFTQLQNALTELGHTFVLNPRLVRGLDYYSHTVFEIKAEGGLGAQNTILAGGRYDGLIQQMGGRPTPGIGWAAGRERLALLNPAPRPVQPKLAVLNHSDSEMIPCLQLAQRLRAEGFGVDMFFNGNLAKKLKKVDKLGHPLSLILGGDEVRLNEVQIKNMRTGEQERVSQAQLVAWLRNHH